MGLIKNLKEGYGNLLTGKEIDEEKARIKICKGCPFYIATQRAFWCTQCPCNMKAKVKAPNAKCAAKPPKW
jgi:L-asparaginase II